MIAGIIAVLALLGSSAVPFIAGWILGLCLQSVRDSFKQVGCAEVWAALLATVIGTITVGTLLLALILIGAEQFKEFLAYLPRLVARVADVLEDIVGRPVIQTWVPSVISATGGQIRSEDLISQGVSEIAPYVINITGSIWNIVFAFLLTPFIAFYLLKDGDFLLQRAGSWLSAQHALELKLFWLRARRRLLDFLKGQVLLCLVQAVFHAVLLSMIGLKFGFVLGIATGLASIIPVLGNFTLFMTSLMVAVFQGEGWALPAGVVAIYGLSELLETVLLAPMLVGNRINVHPLFIITVLVCGYEVFGILGAIFALPFAAIMSTFFDALDKPNPIENPS